MMPGRRFGATGLTVSPLGLGAGELGDPALDDGEADALLRGALDAGVTLIDTARSYGPSEDRIGRLLAGLAAAVRDRVVVSTKLGYGVDGVPDWTGECVRLGVDHALRRLATDRIDIVHLHSCPVEVLARGDVVTALLEARGAGKIRCAAYSGDNEAVDWAVASGQFDAVQLSWSVCDQRNAGAIERAAAAGLGVIAKRPLANAPWRFTERPAGDEAEPSWDRWQALGLTDPAARGDLAPDELAVRFAAHAPGVSAAITGTRRLAHLVRNLELAARGPLPPAVAADLRARFHAVGAGWPARI